MSNDRAAAASAAAVGQQPHEVVVAGRRRAAGQGGEAGALGTAYDRGVLLEDGARAAALAATRTGTACSSSSAASAASTSPARSAARKRRLAARISVRSCRVRADGGLDDGQPVHGGDHVTCVAHRAQVEGGHDGRATRAGLHQAHLPEAQQGLADRRTAHPEPVGELEVAQLLARRERSVDDGLAEPGEDLVAQQRPWDRAAAAGMGMRYIASCGPRQGDGVPTGGQASRLRG